MEDLERLLEQATERLAVTNLYSRLDHLDDLVDEIRSAIDEPVQKLSGFPVFGGDSPCVDVQGGMGRRVPGMTQSI